MKLFKFFSIFALVFLFNTSAFAFAIGIGKKIIKEGGEMIIEEGWEKLNDPSNTDPFRNKNKKKKGGGNDGDDGGGDDDGDDDKVYYECDGTWAYQVSNSNFGIPKESPKKVAGYMALVRSYQSNIIDLQIKYYSKYIMPSFKNVGDEFDTPSGQAQNISYNYLNGYGRKQTTSVTVVRVCLKEDYDDPNHKPQWNDDFDKDDGKSRPLKPKDDGDDGKDGTNGKKGDDGDDGKDGKKGDDGDDGKDGKDGKDAETQKVSCNSSDFHKKVCDWIDWTQDDDLETDKDTKVEVKDLSKDLELDDDKVNFGQSCPSGQTFTFVVAGVTVSETISYNDLCTGFIKLRPFIIAIGYIISAMIIGGRRV